MTRVWTAMGLVLLALVTGACTTDVDMGNGVRQRGRYLVLYEGPELDVIIGTHQVERELGEEWLILAAQFRSTSRSGIVTIERSDISARTPDGRHLPLISQEEFRASYGEIRSLARRAEFAVPSYATEDDQLRICDRWFFAHPGAGFAAEEIHVSSFERCTGPLIFAVPRGIQPGRWRLIIDLEESRADIPFEVEGSN